MNLRQLQVKVKRWLLLRLINDLYPSPTAGGIFYRNVLPYMSPLEIRETPGYLGFSLRPAHAEFVGWMWRVLLNRYSNMGAAPQRAANVFFDSADLARGHYSFGIDLIGWGETDRIHAEALLDEANREVASPVERTVSLEILDQEGLTRLRVAVSSYPR